MVNVPELLQDALLQSPNRTLAAAFELELGRSGLTRTQVERLLGIQRRTLDKILNGEGKGHDITQVLKVGAFCGLDISQTLSMYLTVLPSEKIGEVQDAIELSRLNALFDLKLLKAIGLIRSDKVLAEIVARIKRFFGLISLNDYESLVHNTLFSRTKRQTKSEKMVDFWTTASIQLFEKISNPNPYDRDALLQLVPKIRAQSQQVESGLANVARALFAVGVTVVFQPRVPNTNVKGATFLLDESPCIVITDHGRSYPRLWFSLLHELHHVLYDLDSIRDWTFHLTGESNLQLLQEEKADHFARGMLCSDAKLDELGLQIHTPQIVAMYAKRWNVHPSIIYATFQFRMSEQGENYWGAFRKHFPDFDKATAVLNNSIWQAASLDAAAAEIRASLETTPPSRTDRDATAASELTLGAPRYTPRPRKLNLPN